MPQADLSRRTEARAERSADLLVATATIGDAATIRTEMAAIRQRLRDLDAEQASLKRALAALEVQLSAFEEITHRSPVEGATVTNSSPASAKVELFRQPVPTNGCAASAPNQR